MARGLIFCRRANFFVVFVAASFDSLTTLCARTGPTGPDSSRQGFPSGHASIMSALAVFTSAHLASRFAGARPRPQQPSQQRGVAVSARRDWLLRASRATVASALVMVRAYIDFPSVIASIDRKRTPPQQSDTAAAPRSRRSSRRWLWRCG
jgi:membrane-associated phospholipid phosphatase